MQSNLKEQDAVENKRLSTSTSISHSVANSASPSLISETSNNNSILSKSPSPPSLMSNNGNNGNPHHSKESRNDNDKSKFKKVLHKIFKTKKRSNNDSSSHTHQKKGNNLEKNIYGYPSTNGKSILNANTNLNKNANTVSTSQPASLYGLKTNQQNISKSNEGSNYMTTPNSSSSQLPLQLRRERLCKLPSLYTREEMERKLQNETANNICSEKLTAKEFAAEVGITIEREDDDDYYTSNSHIHHHSCSSCYSNSGIQSTYCSTKSYGPRLDMSIFEPPNKQSTETLNESSKSMVPEFTNKNSDISDNNVEVSLETFFDSKNESKESIEIVDAYTLKRVESNRSVSEQGENLKKVKSVVKPKVKKLSRFEIEVLNGNIPKSATMAQSKPPINNNTIFYQSPKKAHSTGSSYYLNATTTSLPNLTDLNKLLNKNGSGYHTNPSSPVRRGYGVSERSDNVYFNVGGPQSRITRKLSVPMNIPLEDKKLSIEEPKKSKLDIIIDNPEDENENDSDVPFSTSSLSPSTTSSSISPIHFEAHHQSSVNLSGLDLYNLNNTSSKNNSSTSRNMTTTIITPDINETSSLKKSSNNDLASGTESPTSSLNIPSAEELKNIWIDKTIGGNNVNHVNKYHITNFQTEISKADNTIHTTTASHIQDAMTNTESVVFPIQIIKTQGNNKCTTCINDSNILNTNFLYKNIDESNKEKKELLRKESGIDVRSNRLDDIKRNKSNLSVSAVIDECEEEVEDDKQSETRKGKTEESGASATTKTSEDSTSDSNVVQVIQKGRFTVVKEHHDYKHAIPHHYKFVIIRNPNSTMTSSSIDPTKNNELNLKHSHKETLSTIITPTTCSGLTSEQLQTLPPFNVSSPPDSPCSSQSPSLSTISIPHQQLANIAAASLSSNLNLTEGVAYTKTINSNGKSNESNKNEEHVFIVPTNDEKQNNLTCIHSFTSTTTPISSSLYFSTITPTRSNEANESMPTMGPTTTPINSLPYVSTVSRRYSTTSSPLLYSSTNGSPLLTSSNIVEKKRTPSTVNPQLYSRKQESISSSSHILSRESTKYSSKNPSTLISQSSIPNATYSNSKSTPAVNSESKPPLSPPFYPTLNSTVTLVNNNNQNVNHSTIRSEDLSLFTNYSDDTYIHNENESNIAKKNSTKLSEEKNYVNPIVHSETEIHNRDKEKIEIFKAQSVQYPIDIKPFNYSYESLDREMSSGSINVIDLDENNNNNEIPTNKYFCISKNSEKTNRKIVTNPNMSRGNNNLKRYSPTRSYDLVSHPLPNYERRDSYYDYEPSDASISYERKFSDIPLSQEPICMPLGNRHENGRRSPLKETSSILEGIESETGSTVTARRDSDKTTTTTSTITTEHHQAYPHHRHFFIVSNSEVDIPSTSSIRINNELHEEKDKSTTSTTNTRVVTSRQHRNFEITTQSNASRTPSLSTMKANSVSTSNLLNHIRTPSDSSNMSNQSRFIITRECSTQKIVNNEKSITSTPAPMTRRPSRFTVTVTRQSNNDN